MILSLMPLEKTKATLALSKINIQHQQALKDLDFTRKQLASTWAGSNSGFESVAGELDLLSLIPPIDRLMELAEQNPDLLLVPYGWTAEEDKWPEHGEALEKVIINTAQKTGAAVVGTDLVGMISHGPWKGRAWLSRIGAARSQQSSR